MQIITIDFETFYDSKARDPVLAPSGYTLKKMTTESYVRHPWFEVIGVAVRVGERRVWMNETQFRAFASSVDWSQVAILHHHAHFDGLILSHHFGVRPALWLDTLSMARARHSHETRLDLDALMTFFSVGHKGTYARQMDGKRLADLSPTEWNEYGEYAINDTYGNDAIFAKLIPGYPEEELKLIDMTVRMFTEPEFVADEAMLAEFWARETARKAKMFADLKLDKKVFSSSDKFAALLREYGVEPPVKKSPKWVDVTNEKWIYAFAKTDPGMQLLLEEEDDMIRWFAEARIAAKSTLDSTRTQRFIMLGAGGRAMPVYLRYSAAHTFRWGGGDSLNWQNLRRVNKKKPDQGVIKRSIMAPSGKLVVRADSSQIEARGSGWFSGQHDLTAAFAARLDVYSQFASEVYQRPVDRRRVLPDGTEPDFLPGFVGKTCILGLGYGMGWYKLAMEFLKGAIGGPPLVFKQADMEMFGVDSYPFMNNPYKVRQVEEMPSRLPLPDRLVHAIVCEYIVERWRGKNEEIRKMWEFLEKVVIPAMANKEELEFGPGNCLRTGDGGIIMPNGLTMKYAALGHKKREKGESYASGGWSYQIEPGRRTKIYGGLLLENIIQCLSRIVIGLQALLIRERGYPSKTLTHDEVVVLAEESRAQEVLDMLIDTLRRPPAPWATGWPLDADGGFSKRYGDAK